jgi:hypothetical protein
MIAHQPAAEKAAQIKMQTIVGNFFSIFKGFELS